MGNYRVSQQKVEDIIWKQKERKSYDYHYYDYYNYFYNYPHWRLVKLLKNRNIYCVYILIQITQPLSPSKYSR